MASVGFGFDELGSRFRQWFLIFLIWCCVLPACGAEESSVAATNKLPVLTNGMEIMRLTAEQAAVHPRVRLQGVMTYVDPHSQYGFLQDSSAGTVVFWTNATPPVHAGDTVAMEGTADPNIYSPTISKPVFQVLGQGTFPGAVPVTYDDLRLGRVDCQWCQVEGIVRSANTNSDFLVLWLSIEGHRFKVSILTSGETNAERWVEARVQICGVVCGTFNGKSQFMHSEMMVPSVRQLTVFEAARKDPYSLPVTPIGILGHKTERQEGERIRVQGVVTLNVAGKALYVREGTNTIEARTTQRTEVQPGDRVDVIGFYEKDLAELVMEDCNFRKLGGGPPPAPIPATLDEVLNGTFDDELITMPARVVEWKHGGAERTLALQSGNTVFKARLAGRSGGHEVPAGSLVQVTGVCQVATDADMDVQSFDLTLRSDHDVVLLQSPPWWNLRHAFWIGGILVLLGAIAAAWAALLARSNSRLERRVAQRTAALHRENAERNLAEAALRESQALYHSLVDHIPVGIYRKDKEGRFTFANTAYAEPNGVSVEDLVGRTFHDIMPRDIAEAYSREDQVVLETGRPLELDKEHRVPGRETRFLHVLKTPVLSHAGDIIGTQGLVTDITARKNAEAELANERDLLRALLESSPDHIYFKDRDSRFLKCSRKQIERFGLKSEEDIIGKTDFNFFGEEHARAAFADEQQIVRTGEPVVGKLEKESWKGDAKATWVLTSKLPLRTKSGEIIGTFGISKDITDIKEAEAKLEAVNRELLDTSRKAGMAEVATSVLHNVGNVLNSVNTSVGVLTDRLRASKINGVAKVSDLLEQHRADLARFLQQDERGSQVIGYLKTLAGHLNAEHAQLQQELHELTRNVEHIKEIVATQQSYARVAGVVESLSVPALVDDALRMHTAALARHQVRVVKEYEPVPDIHVDKHKALQILVNLMSNAKYALADTPNEERRLTIGVRTNGAQGLRVTVRDNGMGIAPENLTRIFSHGFTTRSEGHGFGLHSGALAARELGGSLTAASEGPGKGATFTLDLPFEPPSRPTASGSHGFNASHRYVHDGGGRHHAGMGI